MKHREFLGWIKTILCETIMVDTWQYAFVKTNRTVRHDE